METNTTATDCFNRVSLSGQMIFLNSALTPSKNFTLGALGVLDTFCSFDILCKLLSKKQRAADSGPQDTSRQLFCLFVRCVLLAESAVFLGFHSVRMRLLILGCVIVALFAFCTCQCDSCTHFFHLRACSYSSRAFLRPAVKTSARSLCQRLFLHPSVALRVSRALPQNPVKRRYEVVCLGHSFLPAPSENFQNLRTKKRPQIYLAFRLYHRLRSFVNTFFYTVYSCPATGEFHACMKIRLTQDTKKRLSMSKRSDGAASAASIEDAFLRMAR